MVPVRGVFTEKRRLVVLLILFFGVAVAGFVLLVAPRILGKDSEGKRHTSSEASSNPFATLQPFRVLEVKGSRRFLVESGEGKEFTLVIPDGVSLGYLLDSERGRDLVRGDILLVAVAEGSLSSKRIITAEEIIVQPETLRRAVPLTR